MSEDCSLASKYQHPAIRTHISITRDGTEYEFEEWMLPLLPVGQLVSIPGIEEARVVSSMLDLVNEFPVQWVIAK